MRNERIILTLLNFIKIKLYFIFMKLDVAKLMILMLNIYVEN